MPLKIGNTWTYSVFEIYDQTKEVNYLGTAQYEIVKNDSIEIATALYLPIYVTKMNWVEYGYSEYNNQMVLSLYKSRTEYHGTYWDYVGLFNGDRLISEQKITDSPYDSIYYQNKWYKAMNDTVPVSQSSCYYVENIGIVSAQYKISNGNSLKLVLKSHSLK